MEILIFFNKYNVRICSLSILFMLLSNNLRKIYKENILIYVFYLLVFIALIISFFISKEKTKKAVFIGARKLWKIIPPFVTILMAVSIVLYLIPDDVIVKYLGDSNSYFGMFIASLFGSITVMPGPIVYPLCGILRDEGVSYSVIAAFSTTLMMVGVLTFPIERNLFGFKFAFIRNLISFLIAIVVAIVFIFAEGILI